MYNFRLIVFLCVCLFCCIYHGLNLGTIEITFTKIIYVTSYILVIDFFNFIYN